MWYLVVTRIAIAAIAVGILAFVLSHLEAATLGIAGDGHLWNMAFGLVTLVVVDAVFSFCFGDRWWFWPDQSVDQ